MLPIDGVGSYLLSERAGMSERGTAEVEVLEVREDKPITRLRMTVANVDGVTVRDSHAVVWTEPV